mmetsp:Transcript_24338/g.62017  ORF Transcript_24338/g.62017 Transcript_24338/m.62017 type:complete len:168 (-) Transcript_24338:213-716(-)
MSDRLVGASQVLAARRLKWRRSRTARCVRACARCATAACRAALWLRRTLGRHVDALRGSRRPSGAVDVQMLSGVANSNAARVDSFARAPTDEHTTEQDGPRPAAGARRGSRFSRARDGGQKSSRTPRTARGARSARGGSPPKSPAKTTGTRDRTYEERRGPPLRFNS